MTEKLWVRTCSGCSCSDEYASPFPWSGNPADVATHVGVVCRSCGSRKLNMGFSVLVFSASELKEAKPGLYAKLCELYKGSPSSVQGIDPPDDACYRYEMLRSGAIFQRVDGDARAPDCVYFDPCDQLWHSAESEEEGYERMHVLWSNSDRLVYKHDKRDE